MAGITRVGTPMAEADRNARVYAGDVLLFRDFAAVGALVDTLRAHCRERLGEDPERVHQRLAPSDLGSAADTLRKAVLSDPAIAAQLNDAFSAVGVDLKVTYGDGLKQRVQPPCREDTAVGRLAPLAAHRDTWGSNLAAQTNWWAPVFPVTVRRTLALFPACFARPVPNDSANWDFAELVRRLKAGDTGYPLLPVASESPPWAEACPVAMEPGDLLCFSGAHLHASVPNTSGRTRLSFETRTVNHDDVAAQRGAPNIDGHAVRVAYQLFKRLTDARKLGAMQRRNRNG